MDQTETDDNPSRPDPNTVIVIQARMTSTRLPGKVLLELAGAPLIVRMVERVRRIRTPAHIVVAATTQPEDDPLVSVCQGAGIEVFRGHPTDLLDRHYQAAREFDADVVAKIPSDCPLIDPDVIDGVLRLFAQSGGDFVSNLHPPSFPDGNDTEVMTFETLETAWREATRPMEREHTTSFIWERPHRFRIANLVWDSVDSHGRPRNDSMSHRWTIDYPEDYAFIRRVYDALYPAKPAFTLGDILGLLEADPAIHRINARYAGVNWYRHHLAELSTISADYTREP